MNWIDRYYKNAPYEVEKKLKPIFAIMVILTFMSTILLIGDLLSKQQLVTFLAHLVLIIATVTSLIVLLRGGFHFTSRVYFAFLFCAMALLRLKAGYENPGSVAQVTAILGSFLVLSSVFISSLKLIAVLSGIGTISFIYVTTVTILSPDMAKGIISMELIVYPLIAHISIVTSTLITRVVFDGILTQTLLNLEEMKSKSEQGKILVKTSLDQLDKAEELLENSQETASAVVQIERNLQSIKENMGGLDGNIRSSVNILEELTGSVTEMRGAISNQSEKVSDSTGAIVQIVQNIRSVEDIVGKEEQSVSTLIEKSREGEHIVDEAMKAFANVTDQIDNIRGMTSLISKIAAQTNLLAMNAAIEAAHAGDSGRGFAVVAQEIRSLAESSSANAKDITNRLKDLIQSIETANDKVNITGKSFQDISTEVQSVSRSMSRIKDDAAKLSGEGSVISESAAGLDSASREIDSEFAKFSRAHEQISSEVRSLVDMSAQISGGMTEISQGMNMISESVLQISDLSKGLKDHGEHLNKEIKILES
ncbi:methyl-accepting chemotaxis protein [Spirochaeta isovalerica]|uniref:Methyl-accepting chemotaxis protein n=1 Tax=Spirochaeta isovalerica TaxID=150 RepID=A0A841R7G3_9SPIO|nr:methyl-accepting chemotaxis protein [Spirochaeta isovalerica]MBB6479766.1 methyl-accepting chemotaxis protein [Spirochaeta isovalerica]